MEQACALHSQVCLSLDLISDKDMLGGVRLTFRDLYGEIEKSGDPTAALEAFLGRMPKRKMAQ
jgi:hypothetical protein